MLRMAIVVLCCSCIYVLHAGWTQTYEYMVRARRKQSKIVWRCMTTQPFTQVICSWNALRPKRGAFTIWGRVRDMATRRWSAWCHMYNWGNSIQASYYAADDVYNAYVVLGSYALSDGFDICVLPSAGADLSNMHMLYANVFHTPDMLRERAEVYSSYPSVGPIVVPKISQKCIQHPDSHRICSPTAVAMLLSHLTPYQVRPEHILTDVYDHGLGVYGSWPCNVAVAYEYLYPQYHMCVQRLPDFAALYAYLHSGFPVIVSVRGSIPQAPQSYPNGHLLVVIGFDAAHLEVICADPASPDDSGVYRKYPLCYFLAAWEKSHRLAYTVA